jgi:hypothetical protein
MVSALTYRAIERNTGSVGLASVICESITPVNPEIAALSQHQDPASDNAAAINKDITLNLAMQIAAVGGDPLEALLSGTFEPGEIGDPTAAGNTCNDENDDEGCIFTSNLLVPDASEDEILAAVQGIAAAEDANVDVNADVKNDTNLVDLNNKGANIIDFQQDFNKIDFNANAGLDAVLVQVASAINAAEIQVWQQLALQQFQLQQQLVAQQIQQQVFVQQVQQVQVQIVQQFSSFVQQSVQVLQVNQNVLNIGGLGAIKQQFGNQLGGVGGIQQLIQIAGFSQQTVVQQNEGLAFLLA